MSWNKIENDQTNEHTDSNEVIQASLDGSTRIENIDFSERISENIQYVTEKRRQVWWAIVNRILPLIH